jgi:hypothetical protein
MAQRKSPEQKRKEARRAVIILVLATALFAFSVFHFLRTEGAF